MMKVGDGAGAGVRTGGIVGRRIRNEFKQQQSVHRPLESFLFLPQLSRRVVEWSGRAGERQFIRRRNPSILRKREASLPSAPSPSPSLPVI